MTGMSMITRLASAIGFRGALAIVALAAAGGGWLMWQSEKADHTNTAAKLATSAARIVTLQTSAATAEVRVAREREQCNADLAGEIQRGQIEADKARKAGAAIASLTTACVQKGPAATNRALRDLLGERP